MPKKRKDAGEEVNSRIEDKLIDNFIKLQRIHTDLAEKFDKLSKEISGLLALFELAARNMSKQTKVSEADKEFLDKIDKLLDQNKTIAKGLTIMEEQLKRKVHTGEDIQEERQMEKAPAEEPPSEYTASIKSNRPLPRF